MKKIIKSEFNEIDTPTKVLKLKFNKTGFVIRLTFTDNCVIVSDIQDIEYIKMATTSLLESKNKKRSILLSETSNLNNEMLKMHIRNATFSARTHFVSEAQHAPYLWQEKFLSAFHFLLQRDAVRYQEEESG